MSLRAFLLRALLCLSLVLNGSGYAVASTQMQLMHAAATQASLAMAHPPCHEQLDEGGAAPAMHVMKDMASSAAACDDSHGRQAAPDCCQSSQCACDCLQYATATLADVPALPAVIGRAAEIRALSPSHVAPALANPIRPPIV